MTVLIWNRPDGSCVKTEWGADIDGIADRMGITPDQLKAREIAKLQAHRPDLAGITPVEADAAAIDDPQGFGREGWGANGKLHMGRLRTIHMDRIREARNKELARADNDLETAEDDSNQPEIARVRARRKNLRDIPQTFDLSVATTPAELKALWPPELPKPR